jgi:16S rRNA (guanine527-N7)-methyltransferase
VTTTDYEQKARQDLHETCRVLQLELPGGAEEVLYTYLAAVLETGLGLNLTAARDPLEAWRVLILQSLAFHPAMRRLIVRLTPDPLRLADIGTGAGVPAVPLALTWSGPPALEVTAIESRGRKAAFLAGWLERVGRERDIRVLGLRAEEAGQDPTLRESQHVATVRGVGSLAEALEYALPLLVAGGQALVAKSPGQLGAELPAGRLAARILGGAEPEVELVDAGGRRTALVQVRKLTPTPPAYPRRPGRPRRDPLG